MTSWPAFDDKPITVVEPVLRSGPRADRAMTAAMAQPDRPRATAGDYVGYVAQKYPVHWIDGLPWRIKNRILEPIVPPHQVARVSHAQVRATVARSDALLARWNEGWDTAPCAWWWICCDDREYDIDRLPRRGRRGARQGLARCDVRRIDAAYLGEQGYAVYAAAHARYPGHVQSVPAAGFVEEIRKSGESGFYDNWGCFVEGRLAAYVRCILLDDVVIVSEVKSDPAQLGAKPNNALIYALTRDYMRSATVRYVTDGSRTVHHETAFQNFLEELGFRRIYCPLQVAMRPLLAAAIRLHAGAVSRQVGLARFMPGLTGKLEAATALWSIARSCRPSSSQGPRP
jgi:hypothetical protein